MKLLSILILSTGLLATQNTRTEEAVPTLAAIATWAIVAPSVSLLVNTVPNPLWIVGCMLVSPNDWASRYALGGIVGGTVGTLAATAVYKALKSQNKQKKINFN